MTGIRYASTAGERGNEHGLASDYIWSMAEDAKGDLWLATDGGGVARWDRRTEQFQLSGTMHGIRAPWRAMRCAPCSSMPRAASGPAPWIRARRPRPETGDVRHFRHRDGDPDSLAADAVVRCMQTTTAHLDRHRRRTEPLRSSTGDDSSTMTRRRRPAPSDLRVRAIREDHTRRAVDRHLRGGLTGSNRIPAA